MARDIRPIGVFDSGMGGISVLRRAAALLPHESFIYYGDNNNAPYGNRSREEILALTLKSARELLKNEIKALLLACNTATAAAIDFLSDELPIPVLGTEPAILRAERELNGGTALMLATQATIVMPRYKKLRERLSKPQNMIDVPCPAGIVRRIERGELERFGEMLRGVLSAYKGQRVDGIVLGCTHYPLIENEIKDCAQALFAGDAIFFDGSFEAAGALEATLNERGISAGEESAREISFMTSGNKEKLRPIFDKLLGARDFQ